MKIHKVEPCSIEEMERNVPADTICSVLRDVYWLTADEKACELLRVAVSMAKKMSRKLEEYYEATHTDRGWEKEIFK